MYDGKTRHKMRHENEIATRIWRQMGETKRERELEKE